VNDRSFTVMYRLLGSGANPSGGGAAAAMLWANANLALLPERAFGVRLRPVSAKLACVAPGDTGGVIADIFGTDVKFGTADWRLVFDRAAVLAVLRPIASSALGLSTRTLQRRLAIAGRNFEAVLDEVRRARAETLLAEGGRDLAEVAYKLGYSEHSAFTRAAIRWFGVPPSGMR